MTEGQAVTNPAAQEIVQRFGLEIKKPVRDPRRVKLKMNIYGRSGVGKTRLALQIAKHFKTFLIFSERSEASVQSHPDFDAIQQNLEWLEVSSWQDVQKAFDYITTQQDAYQWVIIDSLTDINKRIIEDISQSAKDETMSQRQWGQVTSRLERLIRYIRDLRTNVLFVCLSTNDKNDLTGEVCAYPSLTGRLKEEMPAYLDMNGYFYTMESRERPGEVDRCLQFVNSPRAVAKDRWDKLTYEYANMTEIFKKIGIVE